MSFNLFADSEALKRIDDYLEKSGGEFADEDQEEAYDRLQYWVARNTIQSIKAFKEYRGKIDAIDTEIGRLSKIHKAAKKASQSLKRALRQTLDDQGVQSIKEGVDEIGLRKLPARLPLDLDIEDVQEPYRRTIPASEVIDKRLLLKAVKAGVVKDIELITDQYNLVIK